MTISISVHLQIPHHIRPYALCLSALLFIVLHIHMTHRGVGELNFCPHFTIHRPVTVYHLLQMVVSFDGTHPEHPASMCVRCLVDYLC